MGNNRFEDLAVWQKSRILVQDCYNAFRNIKDFSFRDQILRAAVSIMNNIAEGFERKGDKELRKFLFIAKGSSGEVRSMLYLASDCGYINKVEFDNIYSKCEEISKMLAGFISKLKVES